MMLAPALALAICLAYVACLWWLLRREPAGAIAVLAVLAGVALAVRIWCPNDCPTAGLMEDEPKMLRCAGEALKNGRIAGGECVGVPMLFWTLFPAQLVPLIGPTRWAIRLFPLITGVLAVPAAYAVGRGLALAVAPSLGIAALVACLPWSIFYGRIALGGELVFHQLLLLAALVRFIGATGSWPDILVGALGLCGLLHDYFCGRAMAPMPLVAALLARGRYRIFCVAVLLLALIGWLPYVTGYSPAAMIGFSMQHTGPELASDPIATLWTKTGMAFRALVPPAFGRDSVFTTRSAAIHPLWLLALALVGSLTGPRRGLFLWVAFLGGLAPAIVSDGEFPSAHRMLMAFPVIAIAVGCALNLLPSRVGRAVATLMVAGVAGIWGVWFYFSPAFWLEESRWAFSSERTDLVESLPAPPHPPLIVMKQLGYYFGAHTLVDQTFEGLSVDNWVPADGAGAIYAFDWIAEPLRPFYEQLVGTNRVRAFGRAFTVSFEEGQWSWIKQHGWTYEARCGTTVQHAVVPALYHERLGFAQLRCDAERPPSEHTCHDYEFFGFTEQQCSEPITHIWHGRWQGAAALLRFYFNGQATVETTRGISLTSSGREVAIDFPVACDEELRLTLVTPPLESAPLARVMEVTRETERVPLWESVAPVTDDSGASAAAAAASPSEEITADYAD